MREAAWVVPAHCGVVKLPDWEGIDRRRAERVGRTPWLDLETEAAAEFRAETISALARIFSPDLIIVDYLPFGQKRELRPMLSSIACAKYLLHRGVSDTSDAGILQGEATKEIAQTYDRILIASDSRLGDVLHEDRFCAEARAKATYIGFVGDDADVQREGPSRFAVCSAGAGARCEQFVFAALRAAEANPDIPIKLVLGPKSSLNPRALKPPPNCEVFAVREDLPRLHQQASLLLTTGGYNSMIEGALGGARIVVYPHRLGDNNDEARRFAERLSVHYPVRKVEELGKLDEIVREEWRQAHAQSQKRLALAADGAQRILEIVENDLP